MQFILDTLSIIMDREELLKKISVPITAPKPETLYEPEPELELDGGYKVNCPDGQTIVVKNGNVTKDAKKNKTVFLDPAGSVFRGDYNYATWAAGGVSGALYNFLNINGQYLKNNFTEDEFNLVKSRQGAVYKEYNGFGVIHVISKDFGSTTNDDNQLSNELKKSYTQVYNSWTSVPSRQIKEFRMVALSGGIYAGSYKDKILGMTILIICELFGNLSDNIKLYEYDKDSYQKLIKQYKK